MPDEEQAPRLVASIRTPAVARTRRSRGQERDVAGGMAKAQPGAVNGMSDILAGGGKACRRPPPGRLTSRIAPVLVRRTSYPCRPRPG
ncbi:hypothetical protein RC55_04415 [Herbaspirillum seropedicae]|nr:hypothetical protein [Herbaspirillum seropedicae]